MKQWYIKVDGIEYGPVSSDELRSAAARGRLHPNDLLRADVAAHWCLAKNCKGLQFQTSPPDEQQQRLERSPAPPQQRFSDQRPPTIAGPAKPLKKKHEPLQPDGWSDPDYNPNGWTANQLLLVGAGAIAFALLMTAVAAIDVYCRAGPGGSVTGPGSLANVINDSGARFIIDRPILDARLSTPPRSSGRWGTFIETDSDGNVRKGRVTASFDRRGDTISLTAEISGPSSGETQRVVWFARNGDRWTDLEAEGVSAGTSVHNDDEGLLRSVQYSQSWSFDKLDSSTCTVTYRLILTLFVLALYPGSLVFVVASIIQRRKARIRKTGHVEFP